MAIPINKSQFESAILFEKSEGIMDKFKDVRSKDLLVADNVVIDLTGAIKRRDGFTQVKTGLWHSMISVSDGFIGVNDGVLCKVRNDLSIVQLVTVGNYRIGYVVVFDGEKEVVYCSNGFKVRGESIESWKGSSYVGVQSTEAQVADYLDTPPSGQLLEVFGGRMLVADGNLLWYSEQLDFSLFRRRSFIVFDSDITMLKGLLSSVYVGEKGRISILEGDDVNKFSIVRAEDFGAILGTGVCVNAGSIGFGEIGDVLLFTSPQKGICLGNNAGVIQCLTESTVEMGSADIGCAYVNDDNQYIVSLGG